MKNLNFLSLNNVIDLPNWYFPWLKKALAIMHAFPVIEKVFKKSIYKAQCKEFEWDP